MKRLATSENPTIAARAKDVAKKDSRWDVAQPDLTSEKLATLDRTLTILPHKVALPDGLRRALVDDDCANGPDSICTVIYETGTTEAISLESYCYDALAKGEIEPNAHSALGWRGCSKPQHFHIQESKWVAFDPNDLLLRGPDKLKMAVVGFRTKQIEVRTVSRRQVFIGGVPVGDPFE